MNHVFISPNYFPSIFRLICCTLDWYRVSRYKSFIWRLAYVVINWRRASNIMKDNPISILDHAVFWIEYVVQHGGALHLRTAVNDLYCYQYYLFDVIVAMSGALGFALYLNYKLISYFLKKMYRGTAVKSTVMNDSAVKKKKRETIDCFSVNVCMYLFEFCILYNIM